MTAASSRGAKMPKVSATASRTGLKSLTKTLKFITSIITGTVASVFLAACSQNFLNPTPTTAIDFDRRAASECLQGKNPEAIKDYTNAIDLKEENPGIESSDFVDLHSLYAARGMCYSHNKQYKDGITDETRAINLVKAGDAVHQEITINDDKGSRTLSATDAEKNILADYFDKRADCYAGLNDNAKALSDYNSAVANAIDPSDVSMFLQHRAIFYNSIGKYQKAVDDGTASIKLAPSNFANYTCRARSYEKLGQKDLAAKDISKAKELGYVAPHR